MNTPATPQKPEKVSEVVKIRGRYWDEIYKRDPVTGEDVLVETTKVIENKILVPLPTLLAGLMSNDVTFTGGILFHAIGEGDPGWDSLTTIPAPNFNDTTLLAEHFRKVPDSIIYVDNLGAPVIPPARSNIIEVKTTIDFEDAGANGKFMREQGVTGGDATAALNSGLQVNAIRHKAIFKDNTIKVLRFIQFIF